jgi:glycosyltransferase involved in cell wall biosynthesis
VADRDGKAVSRLLPTSRVKAGAHPEAAQHPRLSVVIPVYNEEESVPHLHQRLRQALAALPYTSEVIYVDDGSRDRSFAALREATAGDPRVRIVRFRRNFGQTAAIQAGIEYSRGDVLVFMDADLQNDPDDIGTVVAQLDQGFDVVSGWRQHRNDALVSRKIPSHIANRLISWVTGVHLSDYGCTLKAYRREVLENVRLYGELHRFIPAIASWAGATVTEIPVRHHARQYGKSKYGISRTVRVLLDLLTVKFLGSYSTKPIYVFGVTGFVLWVLAFFCGAYVIFEKITQGVFAHRNPVLLLAVFLATLGVQSIMLGLLAELAIRTYHESQDKPIYVVREVAGGDSDPDEQRPKGERRRPAR